MLGAVRGGSSSARWSFSASSNCPRRAHDPCSRRRTAAIRGEAKLAWPRACRAALRRRSSGRRPLLVVAVALVLVGSGIGAYFGARQTGIFALDRIEVDRCAAVRLPPGSGRRFAATSARASSASTGPTPPAAWRRSRKSPTPGSTATSRTPSGSASVSSGPSPCCVAGPTRGWSPPRRACSTACTSGRIRGCRGSGCRPATDVSVNSTLAGVGARWASAAVAPLRPLHLAGRGAPGPRRRRRADAGARVGHGAAPR